MVMHILLLPNWYIILNLHYSTLIIVSDFVHSILFDGWTIPVLVHLLPAIGYYVTVYSFCSFALLLLLVSCSFILCSVVQYSLCVYSSILSFCSSVPEFCSVFLDFCSHSVLFCYFCSDTVCSVLVLPGVCSLVGELDWVGALFIVWLPFSLFWSHCVSQYDQYSLQATCRLILLISGH